MADDPKPTSGGAYEIRDGKLVQTEKPTETPDVMPHPSLAEPTPAAKPPAKPRKES